MRALPTAARVVIIGGGVSGCSVAYHLAKLGWTDVTLLERKQLTSGTTWHAAGLIAQLRATANMTRMAKYSQELYGTLEEETEVATGFRRCGSITVALTEERQEEILRGASMARAYGVEIEEVSPARALEMYPHLNIENVVGAVYLPKDGQGDPANITHALAKGAKARGASIFENVKVTEIRTESGRVTGVTAERDGEITEISCEHVVNCAGMWAREVGAMAGVAVPLQACEHFYMVTESIPGLTQLPVLRVPDECAYYKEDAGKMLLGAFEPVAKPWGMDGIPEDFCFDELPEDFDHFEPILEMAINRFPALAEVGIHTFFNGPESFTPDDRFYLGEAAEVENYWVACGYNSVGIQSAGGAGMALAQWMEDGQPPFDLWDVDIRRVQPFQANKTYLYHRATEALGLLYADHFPYRQMATARGIRRSPLHEHLKDRGAVFGELAGWERANWFADDGQETGVSLLLEAAETGSTTTGANIWRSVKVPACSTCHRSARSGCPDAMRARTCRRCWGTMSTWRRDGSSIPRCSMTGLASKATLRSRGCPRPSSCSSFPLPQCSGIWLGFTVTRTRNRICSFTTRRAARQRCASWGLRRGHCCRRCRQMTSRTGRIRSGQCST